MNKIKAALFTLMMACTFFASAQNIITSTEAHITISGATTRQELAQIKTDLLAQGIDWRYHPQFDNQRQLKSLDFTVTANDGAIQGSGEHLSLLNSGATIVFHVNKTAGTFSVEKTGESQH